MADVQSPDRGLMSQTSAVKRRMKCHQNPFAETNVVGVAGHQFEYGQALISFFILSQLFSMDAKEIGFHERN